MTLPAVVVDFISAQMQEIIGKGFGYFCEEIAYEGERKVPAWVHWAVYAFKWSVVEALG